MLFGNMFGKKKKEEESKPKTIIYMEPEGQDDDEEGQDDEEEEDYWEDEIEDEEVDEEEEEDQTDMILLLVDQWAIEWNKTGHYMRLTEGQKKESASILGNFVYHMYNEHNLTPDAWDTKDMEFCCVETFSHIVTAEDNFFISVVPVLSAFFLFLAENEIIINAKAMAEHILTLDKKILIASHDKKKWGVVKTMKMVEAKQGIDPNDDEAIYAFMTTQMDQMIISGKVSPGGRTMNYIAGNTPIEPREVVPHARVTPKTGRNEPCPCGSGKKFKKCCGNNI